MNVTDLVDAFVEKVNTSPREPEQIADVPEFLRQGEIDGDSDDDGDALLLGLRLGDADELGD